MENILWQVEFPVVPAPAPDASLCCYKTDKLKFEFAFIRIWLPEVNLSLMRAIASIFSQLH